MICLRRSKRIAEKKERNLQQNPELEEITQEKIDVILLKLLEYVKSVIHTEGVVKKIDVYNQLSSYFLKNKNIIKHGNIPIWEYNAFIKMVYHKYNEMYEDIPEMVKNNKIPKYKLYTMITHSKEVIQHCKAEIWKYRKYLFKLPLPTDIIRCIFLEWL